MIRVAREILPSCRMLPAQTRQERQTPRARRAALIPARAARSPLERPATELDASTEPLHLALQCQGMQRSEPKIRRSIRRSKASAKGAEPGREGGAYWSSNDGFQMGRLVFLKQAHAKMSVDP